MNTSTEFFCYNELNGTGMISVHTHSFVSGKAHRHDFFELEYVTEGETVCYINGESYPMSVGDVVFVTPSDVHEYRGISAAKTVTVHFNPESITPALNLIEHHSMVVRCTDMIKNEFAALVDEYTNVGNMSALMTKNILERILVFVFRNGESIGKKEAKNAFFAAITYINKNFTKHITQSDVCKECGYSPSYFCRIFKSNIGMTFVEYLNKIRLESAARLLLSTDMAIVDICYECGFGTTRNFNREFKKHFGVSPVQYRAKYVHIINK